MSASPRLQSIRPGLWTLELSLPDFHVRVVLLLGGRAAVVWDTLTRPSDLRLFDGIIGDKPYYIVYSHADWDHIWGAAGLARAPLAVVAHMDCRRRFEAEAPATLRNKRQTQPGLGDGVRLLKPDMSFSSRLRLDLGGITLELHHLPGHTGDSIVGWLPEWGVFLGGDAIESPLPVVNRADLLPAWRRRLGAWAGLDALELAIPAHGEIGGRHCLDATVAYLRALGGNRDFRLPTQLEAFYREAHRKNLLVAAGGLNLHD